MRQRNPIEGKAVKDCPNGPENGDPRRVAIPGRRTEIDPRDTIERKEASRVQKLIIQSPIWYVIRPGRNKKDSPTGVGDKRDLDRGARDLTIRNTERRQPKRGTRGKHP